MSHTPHIWLGERENLKAVHLVNSSKRKGTLYQGLWDQRSRMFRFDIGSVLDCSWINKRFVAPRYLVDSDEKKGLILLSIWLSNCGKYYFILYDPESDEVKRLRARCFIGTHYTLNDEAIDLQQDHLSDKLDEFILNGKVSLIK